MRRPSGARSPRSVDERGAVAILTAVLAAALLASAAIAVDLGNAWARERDVQTQVDVSAIAAGNAAKDTDNFPATTPAKRAAVALSVAQYLMKDNNRAQGQASTTAPVLATALTNGNNLDGEIVFAPNGKSFEVIAPPATVDFGMATAFGFDSVDVRADATVGLFSGLPPKEKVIPFWLPNGCVYGPVDGDTTNGKVDASTGGGTGSGLNTTAAQKYAAVATPVTAVQDAENVVLTVTIPVPTGVNKNKTPELLFQTVNSPTWKFDVPGTWTKTTGPANWTFTVTLGSANVTGIPGAWSYQARVQSDHSTIQVGGFTVTGIGPTTTGCSGSDRGNFGQLNSPRVGDTKGNGNDPKNLAPNIALGLDHQLVALRDSSGSPADQCTDPGRAATATRDAEQLDDISRDGNNCIKGDPGNDGPKMYDGFISGVSGAKGRLDASHGDRADCNGGPVTIGGNSINNDLLSCYLLNGGPLAQIAAPAGVTTGILDPTVVDSPRFVWLPIVYRGDRSIKEFQPILKFTPGFITDEALTSTKASPQYTDAVRDNGVEINGNSIKKLTIFTFNPDALPVDARNPFYEYDPDVDRPLVLLTQ